MKYLEITIDEEGEISMEAHGFTGRTCRAATAAIEAALGGVKQRKFKREAVLKQSIGRK